MAKKKPKLDNKNQSERFIKKAREVADDDASEAFERAFKTLLPKRPKQKSSGSQTGG